MQPLYSVRTWDHDKHEFTEATEVSVPTRDITLSQLRAALRELQAVGYSTKRDPSILVERVV